MIHCIDFDFKNMQDLQCVWLGANHGIYPQFMAQSSLNTVTWPSLHCARAVTCAAVRRSAEANTVPACWSDACTKTTAAWASRIG